MSGCCRIDPIHHGGIYIPPLVLRSLPLLLRSLSLSLPRLSEASSRSRSAPPPGVVSPVRPLMPPLSWGRLRKPSPPHPSSTFPPRHRVFATQDPLTFPSLLPHHPYNPLSHPPPRRTARRCNGHCLRVKSFHPRSGTTLPPGGRRGAVVYTIFGTSDRTIEELLRRRCARREECRIRRTREKRQRRSGGRFALVHDLRLPFRGVRVYSYKRKRFLETLRFFPR